MTVTAITLTDPARGLSTAVMPRAGIAWQGHEVTATVREDAEDAAGRDGSDDTTAFLGSAAVTLNLNLYTGSRALLDELSAFLRPGFRPWLVVADSEWDTPRQIQLRFDGHSSPIELGTGVTRRVQYQWKAPRGLWEDTADLTAEIAASVPDDTGLEFTSSGIEVTATYGFTWPATSASGSALVTVGGNARPQWRARLYGPCTGPKLSRDDTGQEIVFTNGLSVMPGDYLEVTSDMTAFYLSDPDASRLQYLDYAQSAWPLPLDPGVNRLRYHASSGVTAGTICELVVTPAWMP